MLDSGHLTPEEYQRLKAQVLGKTPSSLPPAAAPSASSEPTLAMPSTPRRWITPVIVVVVVVVAVIATLVYLYEPGGALNPRKVHVTEVIWTENGNPLATKAGWTLPAGSVAGVSVSLYCAPGFFGGAQTCTSGSVYVETSGFGLANTDAPITWSSGPSGAGALLNASVTTPVDGYSGTLTIDIH